MEFSVIYSKLNESFENIFNYCVYIFFYSSHLATINSDFVGRLKSAVQAQLRKYDQQMLIVFSWQPLADELRTQGLSLDGKFIPSRSLN